MSNLQMRKKEIVVGIDFGTTYSGVSWASTETDNAIRLIQDWPNPLASNANSDKVPSKISYGPDGKVHKWGYDVSPKEEYFQWIKVLLETESTNTKAFEDVKQSNTLLEKLNKSPEDVVSDYLGALWNYTKEDIRKRVSDEDWESSYNTWVVLTVPAVWSKMAKQNTYAAALKAGLGDNIQLVAEPEAAALATLREKAEANTIENGEAFVVCDAGGGTVDLISYMVLNKGPLRMEECAAGEGDLCGSVYLDVAFRRYVKTIVGESQYESITPRYRKMMENEFEHGVKRTFNGDPKVPFSVDLVGVKDNEAEGISDETITLQPSTIETIFDVVCGQIETLVHNQISRVEEKGIKVKAILLVGGFGESKYLHKRLETSYRTKQVRVMQVNGAWSAICRGATMWGLTNSRPETTQRGGWPPKTPLRDPWALRGEQRSPDTPLSNMGPMSRVLKKYLHPTDKSSTASLGSRSSSPGCRVFQGSYGLAVSVPFDSDKHSFQDHEYNSILGTSEAKDQMVWLLKRGDEIIPGRRVDYTRTFFVEGIDKKSTGVEYFDDAFKLYYSGSPIPPKRKDRTVDEISECSFAIAQNLIYKKGRTIKSKQDGKKCKEVMFKLILQLDSTGVDFDVMFEGEVVAGGGVDYDNDDQP